MNKFYSDEDSFLQDKMTNNCKKGKEAMFSGDISGFRRYADKSFHYGMIRRGEMTYSEYDSLHPSGFEETREKRKKRIRHRG
jgi:hypothetical protein